MLNKFNQFPESFKGLIGLTCLTVIIFFTFLILNVFLDQIKMLNLRLLNKKKYKKKQMN